MRSLVHLAGSAYVPICATCVVRLWILLDASALVHLESDHLSIEQTDKKVENGTISRHDGG